jgi:hypothetical protein
MTGHSLDGIASELKESFVSRHRSFQIAHPFGGKFFGHHAMREAQRRLE